MAPPLIASVATVWIISSVTTNWANEATGSIVVVGVASTQMRLAVRR